MSFVAPIVPPTFTLWLPRDVGDVDLGAEIGQLAILRHRRRLVGERIAARRVGQRVAAHERVGGEQHVRADHARVAWRDVEGRDLLMLVLSGVLLVERVRHVERRPADLEVEVERVEVARAARRAGRRTTSCCP